MSSEDDVAKAIREHTAYHKHVIDTIAEAIKGILIVMLVIVVIIALLIFIPIIIDNIFPPKYETAPMEQPSQFSQQHIINQNMSKKIDDYNRWCMYNGIWTTSDSALPICTNQYGDKITPDKLTFNETTWTYTATNDSKIILSSIVNCDIDPDGCKAIMVNIK